MSGGRGPAVGVATRAPCRGRPGASRSYCPARGGTGEAARLPRECCRGAGRAGGARAIPGLRAGDGTDPRVAPATPAPSSRVCGSLASPLSPSLLSGCSRPPSSASSHRATPSRCPLPPRRPPRCPSPGRAPLPIVLLRAPPGGTVPPARRRGMPGRCGLS